jgi:hypothetical protein
VRSPDEYQKLAQEKRKDWAGCDPLALVEATRDALNEIQGDLPDHRVDEVAGPLEEIVTRFEMQSRAALGSVTFASAGQ